MGGVIALNPRYQLSGLGGDSYFYIMAENKKSVLLYCDLIHTVEKLDDATAGQLFKHYLRYINDQNPTPQNPIVDIAFEPIKQSLKRDLVKWEQIKCKRSDAGKISAEKRKQQNQQVLTSVEQTSTNPTVSVSDSVNVSVKDNVNVILLEKETKRFLKPSIESLTDFLLFDKLMSATESQKFATEFYNHYESNGWKVGKNSMKNWKAALSNWISRSNNFKPKQNGTDKPTFDEAARKFIYGD